MRIAAKHHPHPNPQVGAVILGDDGAIISEGVHVKVGSPHAERLAIAATSADLRGTTIVVTLEQCVHHGRRSPCTDVIIEAGITRVVIGALDPDDRVSGRSAEVLRAAAAGAFVSRDTDSQRNSIALRRRRRSRSLRCGRKDHRSSDGFHDSLHQRNHLFTN